MACQRPIGLYLSRVSRFVIHGVRTTPSELSEQLPLSGYTIDRRTDRDGNGAYLYARLDTPVKHWLPIDFDFSRTDSRQLCRDERGVFIWVSAVVLGTRTLGEQPYAGMRNFGIDLGYALDASLEQDAVVDPVKVDWVGLVEIDDADEAGLAAAAQTTSAPHISIADDFRRELRSVAATLAALTGTDPDTVALPPQVRSDGTSAQLDTAFYDASSDVLRYHSWDPLQGWADFETRDPDELMYWIVDDMASAMAWRWAQASPAHAMLSRELALRTLWMPFWHMLVHALRPEWGRRTRETIRVLAHADPHPPPLGQTDHPTHGNNP
jgi:hypothetical protein